MTSFWSSAWSGIKDWTSNCLVGMGGCCSRSWDWLSEAFADSMDWCRSNVCTCCNTDSDDSEDIDARSSSPPPTPIVKRSSRRPDTRGKLSQIQSSKQPTTTQVCTCSKQQLQQQQTMKQQLSSISSPPSQMQHHQQSPQMLKPQSPQTIPQLQQPPIQQPQPQLQLQTVPPASNQINGPQLQQVPQLQATRPQSPSFIPKELKRNEAAKSPVFAPNLKSTSSGPLRPHASIMPANRLKMSQPDQGLARKTSGSTHRRHVEPPKIDFIETGSIFGDRKRSTHQSMLLLENGRFKSPGQSKILPGPGGRSIRMSFQTGFPSFKSIESRTSLAEASSPSKTKRSTESVPTPVGSQEKSNLDALTVRSIGKSTINKVSQRRFKSRASVKSLKSASSLESGGKNPSSDSDENANDHNLNKQGSLGNN